MRNPCHCLYCNVVTGHGSGRKTVCGACQWGPRDEAREIAAGMGPWYRPVIYPVLFALCKHKPITYPYIEVKR